MSYPTSPLLHRAHISNLYTRQFLNRAGLVAKAFEEAFVFKRFDDARIHEGCRICFQRGGLCAPNLRDQCFHAVQCVVRCVGKRSS